MKDIWDFAETADLQDVADLLERQIRYNNAIAEEGLLGDYGANIGRVLLSTYGNDVSIRAKAKAAAGSDARMNGCELPVIINSGSGNQGITCSVPLVEYAKELHSGKEKLYRALIISNLVAIHEKTGIGTLSAYCGAVSAGAGAGAGIVYLCGDGYQAAIHTVSMRWPSCPASCATAQRPPARQRSHPRWTRPCLATTCTSAIRSSRAATAS